MPAIDWENPSGLNSEGTAWYAAFAKDRVVTLRTHTTNSMAVCIAESIAQGEFDDLTAKDAKVAKDYDTEHNVPLRPLRPSRLN